MSCSYFYIIRCNGKFENRALGKQEVNTRLDGIQLTHVPDSSRLTGECYEAYFSCNREITKEEIQTAGGRNVIITPIRGKDLLKRGEGEL